ncbi:protein kinase domain-containing protein [Candidatus Uabimicrobium amorphum]|uniref:Serine/threonine protein kinase n=1 Tax=Uabimicrobium amorphum TaxID=2596890 RepID=A0A5S9IU87_UABAM|nr:protein kinase [Candidatus Uabimicrobium amorphum]BBM88243.1 serine/threonine protein kinase [Candidatus Uabimicrobium amorphum]
MYAHDDRSSPAGKSQQKTVEFGRYTLQSELGRGGMGIVYGAYDRKFKRHVALKVMLSQDKEHMERFFHEMSAVAKLNHPNIVRFYEFGRTPRPYFTMEYIEGVSLTHLIYNRKIQVQQLVDLMIPVCKALQCAHEHNIIHRDIKPSNIMIRKDGVPKLMDFGVAKISDATQQLSKTGQMIGTILYMSPEQVQGKATFESDIYSLGATMYEALTYRTVFQGEIEVNVICQIMEKDPIPLRHLNPDICPYLEAICLKCLQRNPLRRYASFTQLVKDFENYKNNRPIIAKKYSAVRHFTNFILRYKVVSSIVVISFLLLMTLMGMLLHHKSILQDTLSELQEEKKAVEKAHEIVQKERLESQKKEYNMAVRLTKILLSKAKSAQEKSRWKQLGAFGGTALQTLHNYEDNPEVSQLRSQSKKYIRQAFLHSGIRWRFPGVYYSDREIRAVYAKQNSVISVDDNEVITWDLHSGKLKKSCAFRDRISLSAIDQDKKKLALTIRDKICILDIATQKMTKFSYKSITGIALYRTICVFSSMNKLHFLDITNGHVEIIKTPAPVRSLRFNNDGTKICGICAKQICIWSVSATKLTHSFSVSEKLYNVQFHPHNYLVYHSTEGIITWDMKKRKKMSSYVREDCVDFSLSPSGREMALVRRRHIEVVSMEQGRMLPKNVRLLSSRAIGVMCFSSDEKRLIEAYKSIVLWDVATQKKLYSKIGNAPTIHSIHWSFDNKKMVTLNSGGITTIWNAQTGQVLHCIEQYQPFYVKFLADGKLVMYCFDSKIGQVYFLLWELEPKLKLIQKILTNERQRRGDVHSHLKQIVSFSGKDITVSSFSGKKLKSFTAPGEAHYIQYHPKNSSFFLSTKNHGVYLWQSQWKKITTLETKVNYIRFTKDHRYMGIVAWDNTFTKVDLQNLRVVTKINIPLSFIEKVEFSDDHNIIYCSGTSEEVKSYTIVFDTERQKVLHSVSNSCCMVPNHDYSAVATGFHGGAISVTNSLLRRLPGHSSIINKVRFSPDGTKIATGSFDQSMCLWDVKTRKKLHTFTGFHGHVKNIDFHRHSSQIMANDSHQVTIWDLVSKKQLRRQEVQKPEEFSAVRFLQNRDNIIASTVPKFRLFTWDAKQQRKLLGQHQRYIIDYIVLPREKRVISLGFSGKVVIWDLQLSRKITEFHGGKLSRFLSYHPQKRLLAIAGKNVVLYDFRTMNKVKEWANIDYAIKGICFSLEGDKIFILGDEIYLWSTISGKLLQKFPINAHCIYRHPKYDSYAIGCDDGRLYLLNLNLLRSPSFVASWFKNIFEPSTVSTENSYFGFRMDVPGQYIEYALEHYPQKLVEILFGVHVKDSLKFEDERKPLYLWYK